MEMSIIIVGRARKTPIHLKWITNIKTVNFPLSKMKNTIYCTTKHRRLVYVHRKNGVSLEVRIVSACFGTQRFLGKVWQPQPTETQQGTLANGFG